WKEITQSEAYKANFIRSFFANKKEAVKNTQKEASKDLAQSNDVSKDTTDLNTSKKASKLNDEALNTKEVDANTNISKDTTDLNTPKDATKIDTSEEAFLPPLKELGVNYPNLKGNPTAAFYKLRQNPSIKAQVKGAWHRDDIGDIDMINGEVIDAQKHTGYGLAHIIDKHGKEFARFGEGEDGVIEGLNKIINEGKPVDVDINRGLKDIWLKDGDDYFRVRLRKSFDDKETNHWVATAFKRERGDIPKEVSGEGHSFQADVQAYKATDPSPTTPSNATLETTKNQDKALKDLNTTKVASKLKEDEALSPKEVDANTNISKDTTDLNTPK
ncbi:RNA polymerase-binding protein DksA, partial [Helicobacter sp. 11S02629-2]|uniref:putative barnase/colicin E5 family endoribonuclease n=1 Tax=Helicobacter sp. 11S02629-2 TaxID=1476195 RepID=UPI000BC4D7EA